MKFGVHAWHGAFKTPTQTSWRPDGSVAKFVAG